MKFLFTAFVLLLNSNFLLAQQATVIPVYDFFESNIKFKNKAVVNPFTEVSVIMKVAKPGSANDVVDGFCDAADGSLFKVRYMPTSTGTFGYEIALASKRKTLLQKGYFTVVAGNNNGPVRVDTANPWYMLYEGNRQHFFWNAATTYWLLGWKDDAIIEAALERLAAKGINRIRVAINARADKGERWFEPLVKDSKDFTFKLSPWVAQRPMDLDNPGFDVTRFNVAHWQKLDRLLASAKKKKINVSLIFYVDGLDHGCDSFKKENMGNKDEQRYYAYATARYSAYENIMWDITNEYHLFRTVEWVNKMGPFLKSKDINKHILSVHGSAEFPFRTAPFLDVVLNQSWDECGGYNFMMASKQAQEKSGKIMPQINEEYGYEEHYPTWGCGEKAAKVSNGRSAENRIQLAWEICMAGCIKLQAEEPMKELVQAQMQVVAG